VVDCCGWREVVTICEAGLVVEGVCAGGDGAYLTAAAFCGSLHELARQNVGRPTEAKGAFELPTLHVRRVTRAATQGGTHLKHTHHTHTYLVCRIVEPSLEGPNT
jgi:hypothetical protein